jgi:hypothetical protein
MDEISKIKDAINTLINSYGRASFGGSISAELKNDWSNDYGTT